MEVEGIYRIQQMSFTANKIRNILPVYTFHPVQAVLRAQYGSSSNFKFFKSLTVTASMKDASLMFNPRFSFSFAAITSEVI